MTEKYVVLNTGVGDKRGPASFNVYRNIDKTDGMNVCNYKRALRSAAINVNIPNACSKDLVKVTGLSIQELKDQPELTRLIGQRILCILEDSSKLCLSEKLIEVPLTDENPDGYVGEGMVELDVIVGEEPINELVDGQVEAEPNEPVVVPEPIEEKLPEEEMPVEKRHRGRPAKKN
jgi:hypothetical protein